MRPACYGALVFLLEESMQESLKEYLERERPLVTTNPETGGILIRTDVIWWMGAFLLIFPPVAALSISALVGF
jgi:hypothetical protein